MSAALVFAFPQLNSPALVFGEGAPPPVAEDTSFSLVAALPAFGGTVTVGMPVFVSLVADLPAFGGAFPLTYASNTARPVVNRVEAAWQEADDTSTSVSSAWDQSKPTPTGVDFWWERAVPVDSEAVVAWTDADRRRNVLSSRFTDGDKVRNGFTSAFEQGVREHFGTGSVFERGVGAQSGFTTWFQDGLRDRRNTTGSSFQDGIRVVNGFQEFGSRALGLVVGQHPRYQQAMRPPAGMWVRPVAPFDPCYLPDPSLLFVEPPGGPDLLFVCERHGPGPTPGETIVVPVREVYVVVNSATLVRLPSGDVIRTIGMSMSLDVDSWAWSFNAAVDASQLSLLQPVDGEPVDVMATVNGTEFRFIVERISRERTFGSAGIRISGRGRAAYLDAPYSPVFTFRNSSERTAQQLMGDVLTFNGVPLPWTVDWNPEDWSVPTGAFSHQGSYMSALNAIVGSIGAYIVPHSRDQILTVKSRYPTAPWEWASVTPEFELPAAVTTREGVEWTDKPDYNRVFVGGVSAGVFGPVTRSGTDGTLLAPEVSDPLITAAAAHRQRGIAVLSDTGRQAQVSLSLPVLSETGIILPGDFVRYVDGAETRLGITRSVSVSLGASAVDLRQSLVLETHL